MCSCRSRGSILFRVGLGLGSGSTDRRSLTDVVPDVGPCGKDRGSNAEECCDGCLNKSQILVLPNFFLQFHPDGMTGWGWVGLTDAAFCVFWPRMDGGILTVSKIAIVFFKPTFF